MYVCCSVGRYNTAFWTNYMLNSTNSENNLHVIPLKLGLPNWVKVVLRDVGGAICIPGGPVGIICGAIGGSIVGYATT